MTGLGKVLAETFRAARWHRTGGKPECPDCFDGKDLVVKREDPASGLRQYWCKCCRRNISDRSDTPLEHRRGPLALAAGVALMGKWLVLPGARKYQREQIPTLASVLTNTPFAIRWIAELGNAGFTVEKLRKALRCSPRQT
jgi:hypothetical protein